MGAEESRGRETPTIEVRVSLRGESIHCELCDSEEDAALAVQRWEDVEDVECEVEELSPAHPCPEPSEHDQAGSPWEDYLGIGDSEPERSR